MSRWLVMALLVAGALVAIAAPTQGVALTQPRWTVGPRSPLGRQFGATIVWDGRELLELGGAPALEDQTADGGAAAYDPARNAWRSLPRAPDHVALVGPAAVWAGHALFAFGGQSPIQKEIGCCSAGLLDPVHDRWTTTKVPVDPLPQPAAVWTGSRVVLAGITQRRPGRLEVASYDPPTNAWTRIDPALPSGHTPLAFAIVATSSSVLLWSEWSRTHPTSPNSFQIFSGIDVFRLTGGHWTNITGTFRQGQTVSSPVLAGPNILLPPGQIWCGICSHPAPIDANGYLVDPTTLHETPIPHGPLDDLGPAEVWTGTEEIALNEGGEIIGPHMKVLPGDAAIWNPATRHWTEGPRAPVVPNSPPVWDGTHLLAIASDGRVLAFGP